MSQFVKKTVEYNGATSEILVGSAKLVSPISHKDLTYQNDSGDTKTYKLATIEVVSPTGKKTEMLAQVHQRNQELLEEAGGKFEVGRSFLTSIRRVEDNKNAGKFIMFANMSHLSGVVTNAEAEAELLDMFADVEEQVPAVALETGTRD